MPLTPSTTRRVAALMTVIAVGSACSTDALTGLTAIESPASALALGGGDGDDHVAPDPRVPPVCHGKVATIWWNMPADLTPAGASIRPTVPGEDVHTRTDDDAHDDEAPGYVIVGTDASDVIVGSSKRDSIYGANGDDVICADPPQHETDADAHAGGTPGHGGGGPDHVWGGNGADLLFGGGGPDSLDGGNGDDSLVGGGGPDYLIGGNGNDSLNGGPGPDTLLGGRGDDVLLGGAGQDTLDGGSGRNQLDPGAQDDDGHNDHDGHTTTDPTSG